MQSKVLATPLTLGIQMSREERKRGFDCWMNQMTPMSLSPPPFRSLDFLTPVSAGLQTYNIRVSLSKQIDFISRHMMCKGLCWLKGCDVRFWCFHWWAKPLSPWSVQPPPPPSPPLPPGCSYPSALAASPDTLVVVSCHWNDVTRLSDSQGLLLKVIVPAKEKPSPRINGHRTACEQRDKNGREKIN